MRSHIGSVAFLVLRLALLPLALAATPARSEDPLISTTSPPADRLQHGHATYSSGMNYDRWWTTPEIRKNGPLAREQRFSPCVPFGLYPEYEDSRIYAAKAKQSIWWWMTHDDYNWGMWSSNNAEFLAAYALFYDWCHDPGRTGHTARSRSGRGGVRRTSTSPQASIRPTPSSPPSGCGTGPGRRCRAGLATRSRSAWTAARRWPGQTPPMPTLRCRRADGLVGWGRHRRDLPAR